MLLRTMITIFRSAMFRVQRSGMTTSSGILVRTIARLRVRRSRADEEIRQHGQRSGGRGAKRKLRKRRVVGDRKRICMMRNWTKFFMRLSGVLLHESGHASPVIAGVARAARGRARFRGKFPLGFSEFESRFSRRRLSLEDLEVLRRGRRVTNADDLSDGLRAGRVPARRRDVFDRRCRTVHG